MAQFRKKPIVIEAMQWKYELPDASVNNFDAIKSWANSDEITLSTFRGLEIKTPEGVMIANNRDWIVKGVNGEFYPCKPDIFEKTYEAVV